MAKKDTLLQEAIADAKTVRDTALANARIALEEAFTPHLTSMLSAKLKKESEAGPGDGMETNPVDEEPVVVDPGEPLSDGPPSTQVTEDMTLDTSGIGVGLTVDDPAPRQPSKNASDSSDIENDKTLTKTLTKTAPLTEDEDPDVTDDDESDFDIDDEMTGDVEASDDDEDSLDLESIIRELEGTDDEEEIPSDEEVPGDPADLAAQASALAAQSAAVAPAASVETPIAPVTDIPSDDDEEIDLDEILREMEAESNPAEDDASQEDITAAELEDVKGELKEYREAVKFLRSKLQEVNLLNAKLLFTNKLFKNYNMNVGQKMKVVETFDRAQTVREAKLVYTTLAESHVAAGNKMPRKQVQEGLASRAVKSTAPSKSVLTEGADLAARFKKLAGIK